MLVYKVESNKERKGPYDYDTTWQEHPHTKEYGNPNLTCDNFVSCSADLNRSDFHNSCFLYEFINTHREFYYGFETLNDLNNWFTSEELLNLKEMNFIIRVYETSSWIKFEKQMLFVREFESIEDIDIEEFIKK